jgi:hypothetical protein
MRSAKTRSALGVITLLDVMAEGLGRAGQIADGLAAIEEVIARSEHTDERWLMAELPRIKGELVIEPPLHSLEIKLV